MCSFKISSIALSALVAVISLQVKADSETIRSANCQLYAIKIVVAAVDNSKKPPQHIDGTYDWTTEDLKILTEKGYSIVEVNQTPLSTMKAGDLVLGGALSLSTNNDSDATSVFAAQIEKMEPSGNLATIFADSDSETNGLFESTKSVAPDSIAAVLNKIPKCVQDQINND